MAFCTACGSELGHGRYCTNCGQAVDRHTSDTTGRAAAAGNPPPPPPPVPGPAAFGPRYPLFADEAARPTTPPPPATAPPTLTMPSAAASPPPAPRRSRGPLLALAGVVVVALLGVVALGLSGDEDPRASRAGGGPDGGTVSVAAPDDPTTLLDGVQARAPVTAPANQSLGGARVDYAVANVLDGDPSTAWRMPGDGTGQVITMALPQESVITSVGLINGYAKDDEARSGKVVHWYRHNRRIRQVTWIFDDGTEVSQQLRATPRMQQQEIEPIRTATVRLRIDAVSAPGTGVRGSRDYTAISGVLLHGGVARVS